MVADTNTFLAVALDEPEKLWLVRVTQRHDLVAPAVLPYEVGNALSALVRRKMLKVDEVASVWDAIGAVPVELAPVDVRAATVLAAEHGIYAYDAYFLQCAIEGRCSLLTLDEGMKRVARELGITLVENP
jgi:predicted nucleic acid-binding protein